MIIHLPDGRIAQASAAVPTGASDITFFQGSDEIDFVCTDAAEREQFLSQFKAALFAGTETLVFRTNTATLYTSIAPTGGTTNGGTSVVVTGDGFRPNGSVMIGAAAVKSFTYVSKTTLIVIAPPGTAGAKDLVYTDDRGTATGAAAYTYS